MEQEQGKSWKSDRIEVDLERGEGCVVKSTVRATGALVVGCYQSALREISKQATLHGFRKGKAPAALVAKRFKEPLEGRWKEEIARICFGEMVELTGCGPVSPNLKIKSEVVSFSQAEGAELIFEYETHPDLPEIDLSQLEWNEEPDKQEVTPELVERKLQQFRGIFAQWNPVPEGGQVEEGDAVFIDLYKLGETVPTETSEKLTAPHETGGEDRGAEEEGGAVAAATSPVKPVDEQEEQVFSNARFLVQKHEMADWMRDLLLGMRPGEDREGISQADASSSEEEKQLFHQKPVRLVVRRVDRPDLTDVSSKMESQYHLRESQLEEEMTRALERVSEQTFQNRCREQISKLLLEHYPVTPPSFVVAEEFRFRLNQMLEDPHVRGHLERADSQQRELMLKKVQEHAKQAVALSYLIDAIADCYEIQSTMDEGQKPFTEFEQILNNFVGFQLHQAAKGNEHVVASQRKYETVADYILDDCRKRCTDDQSADLSQEEETPPTSAE